MAKITFDISFTTQTGQRKRIKTADNLMVMGQIVENQFISKAKTEMQTVASSKMIGSSFSSIRDFIQACAIVFQRIVARTPIDEAYETTYLQTGKAKNGKKKKAKRETAEHKPDNDVLRNDWVCNLGFGGYTVSIKTTDYDPSIFEKVNDKKSIQVIVDDIVNRVMGNINANLDRKSVDIKLSANFENKNGHFAKLEYGYGGRTSTHKPVKGNEKMHGLVDGYSVQAPSGFFRISMIELGQIMKIKGRASVSKRLSDKVYDISKSHKLFVNKLERLNTGQGTKIKNFLEDIDKDDVWKTNFNDLWKFINKNEDIKNQIKKLDDDKLRIKSLPDDMNFNDRLWQESLDADIFNAEISDYERKIENLNNELENARRKKDWSNYVKLGEEKRVLSKQLNILREGGKASDEYKESYIKAHNIKSRHGKDYLTEEEKVVFTEEYAYRQTISDYTWKKKVRPAIMQAYETVYRETIKDNSLSGLSIEELSKTERFRSAALEIGAQILERQHPDVYEQIYVTKERKLDKTLLNNMIRGGEKRLLRHPELMKYYGLIDTSAEEKIQEKLAQVSDKIASMRGDYLPKRYKVTSSSEYNVSPHEQALSMFRVEHKKEISQLLKIKNAINNKENEYYETRDLLKAQIRTTFEGKKVYGEAQLQSLITKKYNQLYGDLIHTYAVEITKLQSRYNRLNKKLEDARNREVPMARRRLLELGFGQGRDEGKRGTQHHYFLRLGQEFAENKYGKKVLVKTVDYAFNQFRKDYEKSITDEIHDLEEQMRKLRERTFKGPKTRRK